MFEACSVEEGNRAWVCADLALKSIVVDAKSSEPRIQWMLQKCSQPFRTDPVLSTLGERGWLTVVSTNSFK